jgi:hypothetical protein
MRTQLLVGHVLWLLLAANCDAAAWCSVLSFVSFGLSFGDLPGNPSGDITTRWGRTQPIGVVTTCHLPGLIDSGGLGRVAV